SAGKCDPNCPCGECSVPTVATGWEGERLQYFGATWCTYCPEAHAIAKQLQASGMRVYLDDYDQRSDLVSAFKPGNTLPVFLVLHDGKEVTRYVGVGEIKAYAASKGVFA